MTLEEQETDGVLMTSDPLHVLAIVERRLSTQLKKLSEIDSQGYAAINMTSLNPLLLGQYESEQEFNVDDIEAAAEREYGRGTELYNRALRNAVYRHSFGHIGSDVRNDFAGRLYERAANQAETDPLLSISYLEMALKANTDTASQARVKDGLFAGYRRLAEIHGITGSEKAVYLERALKYNDNQSVRDDLRNLYTRLAGSTSDTILRGVYQFKAGQVTPEELKSNAALQYAISELMAKVEQSRRANEISRALELIAPYLVILREAGMESFFESGSVFNEMSRTFQAIYYLSGQINIDMTRASEDAEVLRPFGQENEPRPQIQALMHEAIGSLYYHLYQNVLKSHVLPSDEVRTKDEELKAVEAALFQVNSDGREAQQLKEMKAVVEGMLPSRFATMRQGLSEIYREANEVSDADIALALWQAPNNRDTQQFNAQVQQIKATLTKKKDQFVSTSKASERLGRIYTDALLNKLAYGFAANLWAGSITMKKLESVMNEELRRLSELIEFALEEPPAGSRDMEHKARAAVKRFKARVTDIAQERGLDMPPDVETPVLYIPKSKLKQYPELEGALALYMEGSGVVMVPVDDQTKNPSVDLTAGLLIHELLHGVAADFAHHDMREGLVTRFAARLARESEVGDEKGALTQDSIYPRAHRHIDGFVASGSDRLSEDDLMLGFMRGSFADTHVYGVVEAITALERAGVKNVQIGAFKVAVSELRQSFVNFNSDDKNGEPVFVSLKTDAEGNVFVTKAPGQTMLDMRVRAVRSELMAREKMQATIFISKVLPWFFENDREGYADTAMQQDVTRAAFAINRELGVAVSNLMRVKDLPGTPANAGIVTEAVTALNSGFLNPLDLQINAEYDAETDKLFVNGFRVTERRKKEVARVSKLTGEDEEIIPVDYMVLTDLDISENRSRESAINRTQEDHVSIFRNKSLAWVASTLHPLVSGASLKLLQTLEKELNFIEYDRTTESQTFYMDRYGQVQFRDLYAVTQENPEAASFLSSFNNRVWTDPFYVGSRKVESPELVTLDAPLRAAVIKRIREHIEELKEELENEQGFITKSRDMSSGRTVTELNNVVVERVLGVHELRHKSDDKNYRSYPDQYGREMPAHVDSAISAEVRDSAEMMAIFQMYGYTKEGNAGWGYKRVGADVLSSIASRWYDVLLGRVGARSIEAGLKASDKATLKLVRQRLNAMKLADIISALEARSNRFEKEYNKRGVAEVEKDRQRQPSRQRALARPETGTPPPPPPDDDPTSQSGAAPSGGLISPVNPNAGADEDDDLSPALQNLPQAEVDQIVQQMLSSIGEGEAELIGQGRDAKVYRIPNTPYVLKVPEAGRSAEFERADALVRGTPGLAPLTALSRIVRTQGGVVEIQVAGRTLADELMDAKNSDQVFQIISRAIAHIQAVESLGVGFRPSDTTEGTILDDIGTIDGLMVVFDRPNLVPLAEAETGTSRLVNDLAKSRVFRSEIKEAAIRAVTQVIALLEARSANRTPEPTQASSASVTSPEASSPAKPVSSSVTPSQVASITTGDAILESFDQTFRIPISEDRFVTMSVRIQATPTQLRVEQTEEEVTDLLIAKQDPTNTIVNLTSGEIRLERGEDLGNANFGLSSQNYTMIANRLIQTLGEVIVKSPRMTHQMEYSISEIITKLETFIVTAQGNAGARLVAPSPVLSEPVSNTTISLAGLTASELSDLIKSTGVTLTPMPGNGGINAMVLIGGKPMTETVRSGLDLVSFLIRVNVAKTQEEVKKLKELMEQLRQRGVAQMAQALEPVVTNMTAPTASQVVQAFDMLLAESKKSRTPQVMVVLRQNETMPVSQNDLTFMLDTLIQSTGAVVEGVLVMVNGPNNTPMATVAHNALELLHFLLLAKTSQDLAEIKKMQEMADQLKRQTLASEAKQAQAQQAQQVVLQAQSRPSAETVFVMPKEEAVFSFTVGMPTPDVFPVMVVENESAGNIITPALLVAQPVAAAAVAPITFDTPAVVSFVTPAVTAPAAPVSAPQILQILEAPITISFKTSSQEITFALPAAPAQPVQAQAVQVSQAGAAFTDIEVADEAGLDQAATVVTVLAASLAKLSEPRAASPRSAALAQAPKAILSGLESVFFKLIQQAQAVSVRETASLRESERAASIVSTPEGSYVVEMNQLREENTELFNANGARLGLQGMIAFVDGASQSVKSAASSGQSAGITRSYRRSADAVAGSILTIMRNAAKRGEISMADNNTPSSKLSMASNLFIDFKAASLVLPARPASELKAMMASVGARDIDPNSLLQDFIAAVQGGHPEERFFGSVGARLSTANRRGTQQQQQQFALIPQIVRQLKEAILISVVARFTEELAEAGNTSVSVIDIRGINGRNRAAFDRVVKELPKSIARFVVIMAPKEMDDAPEKIGDIRVVKGGLDEVAATLGPNQRFSTIVYAPKDIAEGSLLAQQTLGDLNLQHVAFVDDKIGVVSLVIALAGPTISGGKKYILANPSKMWFESLRTIIGAERIQWLQTAWDRISPILRAMGAVSIAA